MAGPRLLIALLAAALACACGDTPSVYRPDGGPADFTIGTLAFRDSSGTVQSAGGTLTFWLTDQANSCCAVLFTPQLPLTALKLTVVPAADGSTKATIVGKATPSAGEAAGGLARSLLGKSQGSYAATDGTLAWSVGSDGYYTISRLEVGFAGSSDRLVLPGPIVIPPCTACTPP